MKFVALISGGKDSIYSIMNCIQNNHELVACGHLSPPTDSLSQEADSFMFQSIGSQICPLIANCLNVPLYTRTMGKSLQTAALYTETPKDEVEDLKLLLVTIMQSHDIKAVSTGAIESSYQRMRVEYVCGELGLVSLAYMWMIPQSVILEDLGVMEVDAVVVKVAAMGLEPDCLGKPLASIKGLLTKLNVQYGVHVCGEGGEYETIVLDSPIYSRRIEIVKSKIVQHSEGVWYLDILETRLVEKKIIDSSWRKKMDGLVKRYRDLPAMLEIKEEKIAAQIAHLQATSSLVSVKHTESLADQTTNIFTSLFSTLSEHSVPKNQIVLISIQIPDMKDFAILNAVYAKFFPVQNPPCRVTIEAGHTLIIDILAAKIQFLSQLHVQSISYWAPANIGPYSQSCLVGDTLLMSGMIGLDPASMTLSPNEIMQSLKSCINVAAQSGGGVEFASSLVSSIVYLSTNGSYSQTMNAWKQVVKSEDRLILCVRVQELPRSANVEFVNTLFSWSGYKNQIQKDDIANEIDISKLQVPKLKCIKNELDEGRSLTAVRGNTKTFIACVRTATPQNLKKVAVIEDWANVVSIRVFFSASIALNVVEMINGWSEGVISVTYVPVVEVEQGCELGLFVLFD